MHVLVCSCEVDERFQAQVVEAWLQSLLIYFANDFVVEIVQALWWRHHAREVPLLDVMKKGSMRL